MDMFIRASKETSRIGLAEKIIKQIGEGKTVHVDVMGAEANYAAVKAILMAKNRLTTYGMDITSDICYIACEPAIRNDRPTVAIRWTVKR